MADNEAVREHRLKWIYDAAVKDRCPKLFWDDFNKRLTDGEMDPYSLSIVKLFEEFVPNGRDVLESWRLDAPEDKRLPVDDVSLNAFGGVVGAMLHAVMMKAYTREEFRLAKAVRHISTRYNGIKVPGIGGIGDFETSLTTKRGLILDLNRRMLLVNNPDGPLAVTETLLNQAKYVGEWFAANKECRIADAYFAVKEGQAYLHAKGSVVPSELESEIAKSVVYLENWPLCLIACPYGGMSDFIDKEIVVAFKASERGAAQVMTPRQADAAEAEEKLIEERLAKVLS